MSLCRLMVEDFMHGSGIWDPDLKKKTKSNRNYSRRNLLFGIEYAEDLLEIGKMREPFYRYDLQSFIKWGKGRLAMNIFLKD